MNPVPKPKLKKQRKRFSHRRDADYAAWVRTMACYVCWRKPVDVAHIKSRGAGGDDRGNIVPLCHDHHMQQHLIGLHSFQQRYRVNLRGWALHLWEVYQRAPALAR